MLLNGPALIAMYQGSRVPSRVQEGASPRSMNVASNQSWNPSAIPNDFKWDGHMADDVAATYGSKPLATLIATRERLILSGTRGTFEFPRAVIQKLGRGGFYPWFFSAMRIHHTVDRFPRNLQFKPLGLKWQKVLTELRGLGYPAE
jgi:hypothetical protein